MIPMPIGICIIVFMCYVMPLLITHLLIKMNMNWWNIPDLYEDGLFMCSFIPIANIATLTAYILFLISGVQKNSN